MPGPDYIDLSWAPTPYDGGSPVIAVHVYTRGWDDQATPVRSFGPDVTSCRFTGLTPGVSYTYFMRSENANGIGWWSSSDWAVPGGGAPSLPSSISVTAGQGQVNISWGFPSHQGGKAVQGYHVFKGTNASLMGLVAIIYESTREFIDHDVQLGVAYQYQVSAFNVLGEGPRTGAVSTRSNFAPRQLASDPSHFDDCDVHEVLLTWSHPAENYSHLSEYRIVSMSYEYGPQTKAVVERSNTTFALVDPGGWGSNLYSVVAVYDNGDEVFSNAVYVDHPMCEGVYWDPLLFLLPLLMAGGILIVVAVIMAQRRR